MPLAQIDVAGYRPFELKATLKTKPITVIFGTNSAGKSSMLRLLPLIGDGMRMRAREPFAAESPALKGASGIDLLSKFSETPILGLSLSFEDDEKRLLTVNYKIRAFTKGRRAVLIVEELIVANGDGSLRLCVDIDSAAEFPEKDCRYVVDIDGEKFERVVHFEGLIPYVINQDEKWFLLNSLRKELKSLRGYTWLGPLRNACPRLEVDQGTPSRIDHLGRNASLWLARNQDLLNEVSGWFETTFGHVLEVVQGASQVGPTFSVMISPVVNRKERIPIADTGEGMGQVLSVLTAASLAASGQLGNAPFVFVEHPDLHLHANVHKSLIDYFVHCSRAITNPRFVIESHSEAVLTALQLAILEKRVSHKDVIVHWIESDATGRSFVRAVEFDEQAYPSQGGWPGADWFNEIHDQMSKLAQMRALG